MLDLFNEKGQVRVLKAESKGRDLAKFLCFFVLAVIQQALLEQLVEVLRGQSIFFSKDLISRPSA